MALTQSARLPGAPSWDDEVVPALRKSFFPQDAEASYQPRPSYTQQRTSSDCAKTPRIPKSNGAPSSKRARTYSTPKLCEIPTKSRTPDISSRAQYSEPKPTRIPKAALTYTSPQLPRTDSPDQRRLNDGLFAPAKLSNKPSQDTIHIPMRQTSCLLNELPPFMPGPESADSHDDTPPGPSNDSEEGPFEHWFANCGHTLKQKQALAASREADPSKPQRRNGQRVRSTRRRHLRRIHHDGTTLTPQQTPNRTPIPSPTALVAQPMRRSASESPSFPTSSSSLSHASPQLQNPKRGATALPPRPRLPPRNPCRSHSEAQIKTQTQARQPLGNEPKKSPERGILPLAWRRRGYGGRDPFVDAARRAPDGALGLCRPACGGEEQGAGWLYEQADGSPKPRKAPGTLGWDHSKWTSLDARWSKLRRKIVVLVLTFVFAFALVFLALAFAFALSLLLLPVPLFRALALLPDPHLKHLHLLFLKYDLLEHIDIHQNGGPRRHEGLDLRCGVRLHASYGRVGAGWGCVCVFILFSWPLFVRFSALRDPFVLGVFGLALRMRTSPFAPRSALSLLGRGVFRLELVLFSFSSAFRALNDSGGYVRAGSMGPESFVCSGSMSPDFAYMQEHGHTLMAEDELLYAPCRTPPTTTKTTTHTEGSEGTSRTRDTSPVLSTSTCDNAEPTATRTHTECRFRVVARIQRFHICKDSPHFRVLEAAAYTVACIRRNNLPQPACPFSTSLDAKNIDSPSARTSESVVDVVTGQGWLPRPLPCRRWPPYILSLRICIIRETLCRIGTLNAHILRFLNTTSRTAKPCQRGPPAALPIPNTDADTELSLSSARGNDKHATPFTVSAAPHRAAAACILNELTYHRSVNNTERDGNGAAATDADACLAASADANACALPRTTAPRTTAPRRPACPAAPARMPVRSRSLTPRPRMCMGVRVTVISQQPAGVRRFGVSSPLGDDESDKTTSGGGDGGTHYTTLLATYPACGHRAQPSVVPAGGALASAASQGGMDALEELRLLKDQVRDVSRVCNAVVTGDLTQKITLRRGSHLLHPQRRAERIGGKRCMQAPARDTIPVLSMSTYDNAEPAAAWTHPEFQFEVVARQFCICK
ncbi:hypothetical protein B0H11DRAFT_2307535 [Mycena galericulata]|nr:hypothetical protein B0H11DRAFT_2307535 [Mycena galericulata]